MSSTNVILFVVEILKTVLLSIILYLIYAYLLKPVTVLIRASLHYHGFNYYPKSFLLGHLGQIWTNFPFPDDLESVTRNMYEMINKCVVHNADRSLSILWLSVHATVVVSDHVAVETVLNNKNLKKPFFYKYLGLGSGLIPAEPGIWKIRRKLIEPFFSTKKLKGYVKIMDEEVESFTDQLIGKTGKPVDLVNQIHFSTLNIILKVSTNIPLDDLIEDKNAIIELINKTEPNAVRRAANPLYIFDHIFKFFEFGKLYFKTIDEIERMANIILNRRKQHLKYTEQNDQNKDLISLLEGKVDKQGIIDELTTNVGAGHATTAVALRWILFNLGNHLDEQEKLYQEIVEVFPDDSPVDDMDKINECDYLEKCIKESLRLNPPVHLIARSLEEDMMVKDKMLLEGSIVCLVCSTTHRDPNVYPEPDRFDPDRWNPENASKIPKAAFIPFGYGPRICIGYRYAMIELKIYTIKIIRKFRLKSTRKHGSIPLKSEVTLHPVLPLEIIMTSRNNYN